MRSRADGFTLLELLAALTLTALLTTAMLATAHAQMKLARTAAVRAATADAVRTTAWVLGAEARRMHARDVRSVSPDSLALRAFRGRGIICHPTDGGVVVRYAGDRLPEPRKDSLVMAASRGESITALTDVIPRPDACPALPGESVLELRTDGVSGDAAVVIIFEAGSYYLSTRALRYRLGAEGRQPLTAELLGSGIAFNSVDSAAIRYTLRPAADAIRLPAYFPAAPR